jgi:hypothetical protein
MSKRPPHIRRPGADPEHGWIFLLVVSAAGRDVGRRRHGAGLLGATGPGFRRGALMAL